MGLIPQPSLEDTDSIGASTGQDTTGYASIGASITHTLWRNPADHNDPVDLAVLSDEKRAAIKTVPPRPAVLPRSELEHIQIAFATRPIIDTKAR